MDSKQYIDNLTSSLLLHYHVKIECSTVQLYSMLFNVVGNQLQSSTASGVTTS